MIKKIKIGIIGCGNMGSAVIRGLLYKKAVTAGHIYISDRIGEKCVSLAEKWKVNKAPRNTGLVKLCDVVILAVKPQDSGDLLREIKDAFSKEKICITIMAGAKIAYLEKIIAQKVAIARVMPNLAAIAGESISCVCYNDIAGKNGRVKGIVEAIFKCLGTVLKITEDKFSAVTAISGSGPAYFSYLAESLEEAGKEMGLSVNEVRKLVIGTLAGTASLLNTTYADPKSLRERVTSKGGTTEAALKVFESKRVKEAIKEAVSAAKKKAEELSKGG